MATAMLTERGLRRKITQEEPRARGTKRKSSSNRQTQAQQRQEQNNNNNIKKPRTSANPKADMLSTYQPWVILTYGDLAKTKTITIKKYARILRTLRGEEAVSADNSKFRFWVKAKGFHVGQPASYDAKPADAIVGRYSVCDMDSGIPSVGDKLTGSAKDPPLYVPNAPFKNANGEPVYRKVAVVENFFDIIYNVHVELEGRPGKHAGQKRTYRTITETYAFLPREAVTRFLLGCTECQRRPRSPSPATLAAAAAATLPPPPPAQLPTPASAPTILLPSPVQPTPAPPLPPAAAPRALTDISPAVPPPTIPAAEAQPPHGHDYELHISQSQTKIDGPLTTSTPDQLKPLPSLTSPASKRSSNPLDVCNLTSRSPSITPPPPPPVKISTPPKKRHYLNHLAHNDTNTVAPSKPKLWSPVDHHPSTATFNQSRAGNGFPPDGEIDYSLPITTTYLKYMRSLGCTDEDALKFEKSFLGAQEYQPETARRSRMQLQENTSTPEPSEMTDADDQFTGGAGGVMKDSDKLKLMLLAWNYHNQTQGGRNGGEVPDLSTLGTGEDIAGLWANYHNALGLAKGKATPPAPREQSSPVLAETGSAHDETSSSGNKEDEDDDDDESDDRIDAQQHDPERLKAFNMFVRLFVDENLDRMVPISKQPKEKIQAIIDSCTRQFPEFAERARKRIRTYLKSCRRNKRARDPNSPWDATRPTPAHLTSVQAEQILATACENESHNAKRMRLGLEPVSQPMPILPGATTTDTTAGIAQTRTLDFPGGGAVKIENIETSVASFPSSTTPTSTATTKTLPISQDNKPNFSVSTGLTAAPINGMGIASTAAGAAPTAMYRPNFSQAFQRAGPYPALFPGQPFNASGGMMANGPTDLSMKQKPLLSHKLSTGEMAAVRQLITGYRESAAFLLRSADELEQLLLQQQ